MAPHLPSHHSREARKPGKVPAAWCAAFSTAVLDHQRLISRARLSCRQAHRPVQREGPMTDVADTASPSASDPAAQPAPRHEKLSGYDTFVTQVQQACLSPGVQQALRAGLGRPLHEIPARTFAALLRRGLVPDHVYPADKRAYYAVASLIAARPRAARRADAPARGDTQLDEHSDVSAPAVPPVEMTLTSKSTAPEKASWGTSLGESLAGVSARRVSAAEPTHAVSTSADPHKVSGVEQRLHLLVRQDIDGLHRMMPGVVRQLNSAGIPVDYGRLLHDILRWPRWRDETTLRWLEDYYRTRRRTERPA
ncbi:type I-E CRISPR-associated protein Cse2/CasB [Streptomyces sp. NPDC085596]|uniref:type I-E CRISPR-associated protein Cse2/CasB n=1 Tax=Streptomyces sp. NPDC085596 TaxID=3365731 RepID=UPI0037D47FDA